MSLKFFEIEEKEQLINTWVLFPILKEQEYEITHIQELDVGKSHIKYVMANTKEMDISNEQKELNKCNAKRFFRSEFELAICSSNQLYYYVEHFDNGKTRYIDTLSVLGNQIFINDDVLLSDYELPKNTDVTDNRLPDFRSYIRDSYISVDDFEITYDEASKTFNVYYNKDDSVSIFEISNTDKEMTYGFVLYILQNLKTDIKTFKANCFKVRKKIQIR